MTPDYRIKKIFIDESARGDELTSAILQHYPDIEPTIVQGLPLKLTRHSNPKTVLYLTHSKGSIVKDCPGIVPEHLCCRYQVINQTLNCPLNCSYCILQDYLNQAATVIYTDVDIIQQIVQQRVAAQPKRFFRFGTGELGDSLALPASRLFAQRLIPFFASLPNAILELKTKTAAIDDLLDLSHNEHTVIAWSLNASAVIRQEEHGAALLTDRLSAAQRVQDAGYLLAFHFDPLVLIPDATIAYNQVIDSLFEKIDPARIAWISLGSLRFPQSLEERIRQRQPNTKLLPAEMIAGRDRKMRYFRPLRVNLYRSIYQRIKTLAPDVFVYFCMETPRIWEEVTGSVPQDNAELDYRFAISLYQRFPRTVTLAPLRAAYY